MTSPTVSANAVRNLLYSYALKPTGSHPPLSPPIKGGDKGGEGIGANFRLSLWAEVIPSPCPLPPGERVSRTPCLDGRRKGDGDNRLILLGQVP